MTSTTFPDRRFSGFESPWELARLGDLAKVTTGSRDTKDRIPHGPYPFFVRSNNVETIDTWSLDTEAVLTSGDGVGVGKNFHYINGKFDFHQRVYAIYDFSSQVHGKYFYHFFSANFIKRVQRLSAKNSVDSVRMAMITDMMIPIPPLAEQVKLAELFDNFDKKIAEIEAEIQTLREFKRSCLERIYNGELQFGSKSDARSKWQTVKLSSIAKIFDGTHQTPNYVDSGIPFFSVENVTGDNFSNTKFISEDVYAIESRRVRIEKGDILLTRIGDIGTIKLVDWDVEASFYVSLALIKVTSGVDSGFLSHFMQSEAFQKNLWKKTIHVAFPKKINLGEIGECQIELPPLKEQKKIADFLGAIDSRIKIAHEMKKQSQMLKTSLVQSLLTC